MMKENRSFDEILGRLSAHGQPGAEPIPDTFSNLDAQGVAVKPFHVASTCVKTDPPHSFAALHNAVNVDKMDGFVKGASSASSDGHYVMGYFEDTDLPFYYFLANTFAVGDHNFSSVRGSTCPNRDYLLVATSDGIKDTMRGHPAETLPTIMSELDKKGVTWGAYIRPRRSKSVSVGPPTTWACTTGRLQGRAGGRHTPCRLVHRFTGRHRRRAPHGRSPGRRGMDATIYQSVDQERDLADHRTHLDLRRRRWIRRPRPSAETLRAAPADTAFIELGRARAAGGHLPLRRPALRFARGARAHVDHALRRDGVRSAALTARDANSDALLDMFDFGCPPDPPFPLRPPREPRAANLRANRTA